MQSTTSEETTFLDLSKRWNCSQGNLYHFIETGKLIPSTFIRGTYREYQLERAEFNETLGQFELFPEEIINDVGKSEPCNLSGFFYLSSIFRSSTNTCTCEYFSVKRDLEEFDLIYRLETPIILEILDNGDVVGKEKLRFTVKEIERFESENFQSISLNQESIPNYRARRQAVDITQERGARRQVIESWDEIEKLHPIKADGTQVLRIIKRIYFSSNDNPENRKPPTKKTIQNLLINLRKEGLIP